MSSGAYYETAFHELGHHSEVRLGWDHRKHGYDFGELVAEMTASLLSAELGVPAGRTARKPCSLPEALAGGHEGGFVLHHQGEQPGQQGHGLPVVLRA